MSWFPRIGWYATPPEVAIDFGLDPSSCESWGIVWGRRAWFFVTKGYPLENRLLQWQQTLERETYHPKPEPEVESRRDNR